MLIVDFSFHPLFTPPALRSGSSGDGFSSFLPAGFPTSSGTAARSVESEQSTNISGTFAASLPHRTLWHTLRVQTRCATRLAPRFGHNGACPSLPGISPGKVILFLDRVQNRFSTSLSMGMMMGFGWVRNWMQKTGDWAGGCGE